jgi:hypothetical protein
VTGALSRPGLRRRTDSCLVRVAGTEYIRLLYDGTICSLARIKLVSRSGWLAFFLDARVIPVTLGVAFLMLSARQRIKPLWPIIGAAIVAVLGGTTNVHLTLAANPDASSVGIDTALLPMFFRHSNVLGKPDVLALAIGLARAAMMIVVAAMISAFWRNRRDRSSMASICYARAGWMPHADEIHAVN